MVGLVLEVLMLLVLLAIGIFLVVYAFFNRPWKRNISYIALPEHAIDKAISALELKDDSVLFDLGCGDGRVLAAALNLNPRLRCVGIEHNPLVRILARRRLSHFANRVEIIGGDILRSDLESADRVFTYLNHPTMAKLEPKLTKDLQRGARLVSCDFPLPNAKPHRVIKVGSSGQLAQTLYVYRF